MTELAGWGRYPKHESELVAARSASGARSVLAANQGVVARGMGRAYGDAAIGHRVTLDMRGLDRMKSFDPATGRVVVEAGVPLSAILHAFAPRGFFPPVVPGTKFVTVGGMIAADVHGKNHHR
nr:FAD-binding oxidoreductase [Hyphomicrobiales bacterium]